MEPQIGKEQDRARLRDDRRELALDLTASEVVLHEGSAARGWRRFAGVALDDPEFLEVIALLREEAESEVGRGRPVTIWLPGEQVLRLSARLDGQDADARLAAAFGRASRETGQAAEELAVALGPTGPGGETPLLVTYAATWREARGYAERWGFVPGAVSTRHHAEEFGPEGPEFRLGEPGGEAREEAGSRRLAWLAVGLAAIVSAALPDLAVAKGPAAAPVPAVRAVAVAPADAASMETPGFAAVIPLARPDPSGDPAGPAPSAEPADGGSPPLSGEAAAPGRSAAPGGASGSLAAPLPPVRPAGLAPALRHDRVALIGILNLDSGREALLRLPNGEFVTVRTGEVLDGWEVAAIGPDTMQVRRGERTLTLVLVSR